MFSIFIYLFWITYSNYKTVPNFSTHNKNYTCLTSAEVQYLHLAINILLWLYTQFYLVYSTIQVFNPKEVDQTRSACW